MVTLKELLIKPPPANPKKVKISKNPHQRSYYNQNKAIINKLACVLKKKQYQSILKNKYEKKARIELLFKLNNDHKFLRNPKNKIDKYNIIFDEVKKMYV